MVRKLSKISQVFLIGLLIYAAFISILYFRMKNAEKMLADYYEAQACPSPSNCRAIIQAKISDYASSKVSFINYGSRGVPLERGTFQEYVFVISRENAKTETVKVLPCTPLDPSGFDVAKIYIPAQSDEIMTNSSLFDGKTVSVESWRGRITLIFMSVLVPVGDQTNETAPQAAASIGPLKQELHEFVLPTQDHPVIRAELTRQDFDGWTGVVLFIILCAVFGIVVSKLSYGMNWMFGKVFRKKQKNS